MRNMRKVFSGNVQRIRRVVIPGSDNTRTCFQSFSGYRFEKKLVKSSAKIDAVQINSRLSEIADDLNKIIGEAKIVAGEGE